MSSDSSADRTVQRTEVLVVDGANVVGSRPDGWWRDRPGAAARLYQQLRVAPELSSTVILVLEGKARAGVPANPDGPIAVVHAPREGDDTIVEEARRAIVDGSAVSVVTADRGLMARVQDLGATVLRPGWLLDRIG